MTSPKNRGKDHNRWSFSSRIGKWLAQAYDFFVRKEIAAVVGIFLTILGLFLAWPTRDRATLVATFESTAGLQQDGSRPIRLALKNTGKLPLTTSAEMRCFRRNPMFDTEMIQIRLPGILSLSNDPELVRYTSFVLPRDVEPLRRSPTVCRTEYADKVGIQVAEFYLDFSEVHYDRANE